MKVRILPPAPRELRISNRDLVNKFAIRNSQFEIYTRVAKLVKAPVRKTGHREFESRRAFLMRRWSRNQARLAHNQQIIR